VLLGALTRTEFASNNEFSKLLHQVDANAQQRLIANASSTFANNIFVNGGPTYGLTIEQANLLYGTRPEVGIHALSWAIEHDKPSIINQILSCFVSATFLPGISRKDGFINILCLLKANCPTQEKPFLDRIRATDSDLADLVMGIVQTQ